MQKKTSQLIQSIFDVSNPMLLVAERIFDLLLLNLLTLLASLPLLTFGIAKLALQASLRDLVVNGKISLLATYWTHLKFFWKRGLVLSLLEGLVTGFCLLDLYLLWGHGGLLVDMVRVLALAVLLFSQLLWVYLYPLAVSLDLPLQGVVFQAIFWMGGRLGLTGQVALLYLGLLAACLYSDMTLLFALFFMACLGYALFSYWFIKALGLAKPVKDQAGQ